MENNLIKISLEDFNLLSEQYSKGTNNFDPNNGYVITLENCNGLTTDILESFRNLPVDIKFKIDGDLYGNTGLGNKLQYNYTLDEMEKIISVFEEIGRALPDGLSEIGRFLAIYRILSESIEYNEILPANEDEILEVNGLQRSLYSTLLNGDGVCVGYALTLKNILNYYNINCMNIGGTAHLSNGISGKHAWNAVEIDGKWYFTDITWDAKKPAELRYCLMASEEFLNSHELDQRSIEKLSDCNFADEDYDHSELKIMMKLCHRELNLRDAIERVKSHHIEKKKIKTVEDMGFAELFKDLFGEERFESLLKKSMGTDYQSAVETSTDTSYRTGTLDAITKGITADVKKDSIEQNDDKVVD